MKILVTGGAGFIGTNLIKRLLKEGHTVYSLDNYSTGLKDNEIEGCIYYNNSIKNISVYIYIIKILKNILTFFFTTFTIIKRFINF